MAAAFNVNVYGEIMGQPPFSGSNPFARSFAYSSTAVGSHSFPVATTNIHPINPGQVFGGVYCYGVIEEIPSGLETGTQGKKFAVKETVAVLATLRG